MKELEIEAGGDTYAKLNHGGWARISQDNSILGECTKRENRLLDEIERLKDLEDVDDGR